jgi:hypothetical protein
VRHATSLQAGRISSARKGEEEVSEHARARATTYRMVSASCDGMPMMEPVHRWASWLAIEPNYESVGNGAQFKIGRLMQHVRGLENSSVDV